ncbi:M14 family zinc carboxypeptidase [Pseudomonadota bacterium]|nr:M14 family zinc carboxypeptidase [Pseudomonadota bacterium]
MHRYILLIFIFTLNINANTLMDPTSLSKDLYKEVILDDNYIDSVDHPNEFLDFDYATRVATPEQITSALKSWANQSDKLKVIEYARSHENRPLHAVFISSPENLKNLNLIKDKISQLADARVTNDRKAKTLINELPAVAWMAYSIHGNETSGADAALGVIYHLIASKDDDILELLDEMVIIVDPLMNPDGRARFAKNLEQYRGTAPNYDDQSLIHTGDWPYGRTNHYYFDLNRDWVYLTQPETQGRVALINEWKPQILVDAHEMGSQDTFMTGPAREPINKNVDYDLIKWGNVFAKDQGSEFDRRNWRFYTGEWHEDLYPGYSFYVAFRGTLGILYEQSRMAEDGVRRPEGTIQSYKESVHHQFVSTMINLDTLKNNTKSMYQDYWDGRKYNVSSNSKYSNRSYVVLATDNNGRINALAEKLKAQDIEIYKNDKPINVSNALKQNGNTVSQYTIPSGSMIIPNNQPEAPLVSAILEFDAEIDDEVLIEEKRKRIKNGSSIMYDTTAFNFTMMFGLPAITVPQDLKGNLSKWSPSPPTLEINKNAVIWAVDGKDDRSVAFAARLLEQNIQVRIIDKDSILSGHDLSRGSVAVIAMDNPSYNNLHEAIETVATDLDISVVSIESGFGPKELPDWGGRHFRLLKKPQIAILSHSGFNSYDVGVSWWSLDHHLGIRHSQLNSSLTGYGDLRRYNTIILPSGNPDLNDNAKNILMDWVKQGGTLIAHNRSTRSIISTDSMGSVKSLNTTFDKSKSYNMDLMREIYSLEDNIDISNANSNKVDTQITYPWETSDVSYSKEQLEMRDKWQSTLMPSGAIVSARADSENWLTFGAEDVVPVLYGNYPILMTGGNSTAALRVGELIPNEDSETKTINWSQIPSGYDLNVRMSGLVWPEASQRIANSAYLTREKIGKGQIILFSGEPNFRGSARGTNRLWLNAVIYGSGLGTNPLVNP